MEGLSGRVGDNGHAFGPFQMNDAGGVLTGRAGNHRSYAESPQGIEDAVSSIAKVAGGLKGNAAVNAIVRRYERPADPGGEVERALQSYGRVPGGKGAQVSPASPGGLTQATAGNPSDLKQLLVQSLLGATSQFAQTGQAGTVDPGALQLLQQLAQTGSSGGFGGPAKASTAGAASLPSGLKVSGSTEHLNPGFLGKLGQAAKALGGTELVITSGFRDPQHNASVGGVQRSNHLTGHAVDGYIVINGSRIPLGVAMKAIATKYGLRSGDQPGFFNGGPDPVHVDDGANMRI